MKAIQNNPVEITELRAAAPRRNRRWFSRMPYADAFLCISRRRGFEITSYYDKFMLQLFGRHTWFRIRVELWGYLFMTRFEKVEEVQTSRAPDPGTCDESAEPVPARGVPNTMTATEVVRSMRATGYGTSGATAA